MTAPAAAGPPPTGEELAAAAGRTCGNCSYFDTKTATCRAQPPVIAPDGNTQWPQVAAADWCASFHALSA